MVEKTEGTIHSVKNGQSSIVLFKPLRLYRLLVLGDWSIEIYD